MLGYSGITKDPSSLNINEKIEKEWNEIREWRVDLNLITYTASITNIDTAKTLLGCIKKLERGI